MNRRDFILQAGASVAAPALGPAALSGVAQRTTASAASSRPNVLLMICDDLGFGDLGCYGSQIPTPHLDALAAQGTRGVRYNTAHPICSASRAALLTGRYAPRSHTEGAYWPHSKVGMDLDETTLANLFHARGYRTHAIGKWHLGDAPEYLPTSRGFDSYYGVCCSDDMAPLALIRDTNVLETDTDRTELTPRYTAEALKLLADSSPQPFFLYLAYSYPHDPARGSKNFAGRSAFGDFGDAVEEIDWSVDQILGALEKSGKARDTIVIFTSDHGPWFQGSPGLTRGRKGTCFEGGVRIPFLIRWPGHVPPNTVAKEWLSHLDMLPTLSQWCGLPAPKLPLDGVDVSPVLLHGQTLPERPIVYFSPAGGHNDVHCIRRGAWKLRVAQNDGETYINDHTQGHNSYWLAHPELYNLDRDPLESYDVAKRNPEVVAQLLAELDREMLTFPDDVQARYATLKTQKASVTTPPAAAPRILTPEQIREHDWSFEPPERKPV